jgi:hypothetical protein
MRRIRPWWFLAQLGGHFDRLQRIVDEPVVGFGPKRDDDGRPYSNVKALLVTFSEVSAHTSGGS